MRPVPGLGDDAFFVEDPKEDPGGSLYVRVGHWRVVIYRQADTPLAKSESVLPTLTAFLTSVGADVSDGVVQVQVAP